MLQSSLRSKPLLRSGDAACSCWCQGRLLQASAAGISRDALSAVSKQIYYYHNRRGAARPLVLTFTSAQPSLRTSPESRNNLKHSCTNNHSHSDQDVLHGSPSTSHGSSSLAASTSVVKLVSIRERPRADMPLLLGSINNITRCATTIKHEGKLYLLTSSSAVAYSTQTLVSVPGVKKPFKAHIQCLAVECELALLRVDDTAFWNHMAPLDLGTLPKVQDHIKILGPPAAATTGSETQSVPGTVARVEVMGYPSSLQRLLGLHLSASITADQVRRVVWSCGVQAGGAPVVCSRGRCVGIIFRRERRGRSASGTRGAIARGSSAGATDDAAYAVPCEVISHLLKASTSPGGYVGLPSLGVRWKMLEATPLRRFLSMQPEQQGILILDVNPTSNAAQLLQPNDVLLAFNGQLVGNDGTVAFGNDGAQRISLVYVVSQLQVGDTATLVVLRGGQELQLDVKLNVPQRLLPTHLAGRQPSYLVLSGLVFVVASVPYLEAAFGARWACDAPARLLDALNNPPSVAGEELVVLGHCEDLPALEGYDLDRLQHTRVTHFDGLPVTNLRQLARAVLSSRAETFRFDMRDGLPGMVVVLPVPQARADTRTMLAEYQVEHAVSDDLKDLLQQRKAVPARRVLRR